VTQTLIHRAIVPDGTRSRLLVVAGERPSLPTWTLEDAESVDGIRGARDAFGIDTPFLRMVRVDGDVLHRGTMRLLMEFEAPSPEWAPPIGLTWIAIDDIRPGTVDAEPFAAGLAEWTEELRSGAVPARRPDWSRPGWHAATSDWLAHALSRLGVEMRGPVEQLGSWAISSLLAVDTDQGRLIVKSVPPMFGHEPALTLALATEHPGLVSDVLVSDPVRRHLVMRAFGGSPLGSGEPSRWSDGLTALAAIEQSWIGRRDEATRIGVEDRSLAALDREVDSIVIDEAASPGLEPSARDRLVSSLPRLHELIRDLAAGPVPETLVHGDFHPWNVQRDGDGLVIFDWSDACWGHPFFDVPTMTSRTDDLTARESLREAVVGAWSAFGDRASIREALSWSEPLTELHLSITWRRLQGLFEADGAYPFVDSGVQRHLELALAAIDALNAGAD
jgi:hypothetical protein